METINHECYVSFEVAKLLKEAGFDWECCYCYEAETKDFLNDNEGEFNFNEGDDNDFYSAPTLAVAQRWLREEKGFLLGIRACSNSLHYAWEYSINKLTYINEEELSVIMIDWISDNYKDVQEIIHYGAPLQSYEDTLEAGIQKCLTILLEE